jgi:hypothetical protein
MWLFVYAFLHSVYRGLSTLKHVSVFHSFLYLNNTAVYEWATFCCPSSIDGRLGCFHLWVTRDNTAGNLRFQFFWTCM